MAPMITGSPQYRGSQACLLQYGVSLCTDIRLLLNSNASRTIESSNEFGKYLRYQDSRRISSIIAQRLFQDLLAFPN